MFIDADGPNALVRSILNSIVIPRPIGWISTVSKNGQANLAPFSYFNVVSAQPPIVMFSCSPSSDRPQKDSARLAKESGEFVHSFASVPQMEAIIASSTPVPFGEDEFELAGLKKAPSIKVRPSRVADSPAALECRVEHIVDLPHSGPSPSTIVFGRVVAIHVADEFVNAQGRFDAVAAMPLCRLGGLDYSELGRIFQRAWPGMKI